MSSAFGYHVNSDKWARPPANSLPDRRLSRLNRSEVEAAQHAKSVAQSLEPDTKQKRHVTANPAICSSEGAEIKQFQRKAAVPTARKDVFTLSSQGPINQPFIQRKLQGYKLDELARQRDEALEAKEHMKYAEQARQRDEYRAIVDQTRREEEHQLRNNPHRAPRVSNPFEVKPDLPAMKPCAKRQIQWSPGLRKGLAAEAADYNRAVIEARAAGGQ
eukprot:GFYU01008937.1.p1 GENE.GFYU01008937.1~~GFYU01008937.1.p1  ORF type:complete len:250 (+),score=22.35 GFYU01008937.1:100-750(+)